MLLSLASVECVRLDGWSAWKPIGALRTNEGVYIAPVDHDYIGATTINLPYLFFYHANICSTRQAHPALGTRATPMCSPWPSTAVFHCANMNCKGKGVVTHFG